jgi:hypothetical protein
VELLTAFPDAEDIGLDLLASLGPTVLVTPATLVPPLIVVRRVGGFDSYITDRARLQVQCFGSTHVQARDLAEACRQKVLAAPGADLVAGVAVDRAVTESAPTFVDYGQPSIHRYVATYRLEVRRGLAAT